MDLALMSFRGARRGIAVCALAGGLALVPAVTASADNVVADDQIVQGSLCVGVLCSDGEPFSGPALRIKTADTPGISLIQTADSGFAAQTWDVAGNEANFFVRDLTSGSRLPFRIRPGAPTGSVDIQANGSVNTAGVVQQSLSAISVTGDADGSAILAALRNLPIKRYTINADSGDAPHLTPEPAAFRAAFTLGGQDDKLGAGDVAAIALAAVKQLDARVSSLSLTPGPQGPQGPQGVPGEPGAQGTGSPDVAAAHRTAQRKIAALQSSNRKLSRNLRSLRRQVKKLRTG